MDPALISHKATAPRDLARDERAEEEDDDEEEDEDDVLSAALGSMEPVTKREGERMAEQRIAPVPLLPLPADEDDEDEDDEDEDDDDEDEDEDEDDELSSAPNSDIHCPVSADHNLAVPSREVERISSDPLTR